MGQYIKRADRTPPHFCRPPKPEFRDVSDFHGDGQINDADAPARGDVWMCECGKRWKCKGYVNERSFDTAQWKRSRRPLWGKQPPKEKA